MNRLPPSHIQNWLDGLAINFRSKEEHEVMVFEDRDAAAMRFVIDCLINPENEIAGMILDKLRWERDRRETDKYKDLWQEKLRLADSEKG